MPDERSVYNIVTLRNIDDEDFVFMVDKVEYVIPRGQTRNFPKFMAALAVKHLTDKLLMKEDTSGLSLMNDVKRQEMAAKIVLNEQNYEKPIVPSDKDIVDDINRPTDLDLALNKNKGRLKEDEQVIAPPAVNVKEDEVIIESEEKFEGLETTKALPSREKMMNYAKNTLGIDFDTVIKAPGKNKGKSIRDVYVGMSDTELFNEFQLEGVEL
jgi:hypothetical protein